MGKKKNLLFLFARSFRLEIKNGTENVRRRSEFSSQNRKRDRKCPPPFRVFVSKSKTRQKMSAAVPRFRREIENGTENVRCRSEFSSRNRKRDRKCSLLFRVFV